jgi:DNA ligase 1
MEYKLGQEIYKLDSKSKLRVWKIDVVDYGRYAEIITTAGLQDGKKAKTVIPIHEGKNIGKSNETTYYTQAVSEALASAELKLRGEYRFTIEELEHQVLRSGIVAPMLAHKYDPTMKQSSSKNLEKWGILETKIHVQPKYDGNRCLIKLTPETGTGTMYTRKGDVMPVQLRHILTQIDENWNGLEEVILDGELFSNEMTFNELNGHLKRKTSQDAEALSKFNFMLYDIVSSKGYSERYNALQAFASHNVVVVPSFPIIASETAIDEKLNEFLNEGHEGLMIRRLDIPYENKRSKSLLKYKVFEDKEFIIIGVEEDAREGMIGKFVLQLDVPNAVDRQGKPLVEFRAGVKDMTQEDCRNIWDNQDKYIGKTATVEFFGRSEYGVPRIPKVKQINRSDI